MENDLAKQAQEIYERTLKQLRFAIKNSGLNDEEIAERCGDRSAAWINRIRNGQRGTNLPFKTILQISLALNLDLTSLYLSSNSTQARLQAILSEINKMIVNE